MRNLLKSLVVAVLTWQARAVLRKYSPKIVAITGSVGKTSTKDAIFTALSKRFHVRKSEKSFNSEVGIPLTVLGAPNAWNNPLRWLINFFDGLMLIVFDAKYPEWLVLEVGADRPGDIQNVAKWLKVDVAVITRLPEVPVHVEFFDSVEQVIEEKAALITALKPYGTLILYGDDEKTLSMERRLPGTDAKLATFGFDEDCDVRGADVAIVRETPESWPVGMRARIEVAGHSSELEIRGCLGAHAFLPALGAAAVALALGMSLDETTGALRAYEPPAGRMHLIPGLKGTLIIDDTYNSSPAAVEAALETLKLSKKPGSRRIAVLGDMLELGRLSVGEHRKIGQIAAKSCDLLLTVGFRARDIAGAALDNKMKDEKIFQYEDSGKAGKELEAMLKEGDIVLVKGSQSMRMEKVVEEIMAEPDRAPELLVRQDAEWIKR